MGAIGACGERVKYRMAYSLMKLKYFFMLQAIDKFVWDIETASWEKQQASVCRFNIMGFPTNPAS